MNNVLTHIGTALGLPQAQNPNQAQNQAMAGSLQSAASHANVYPPGYMARNLPTISERAAELVTKTESMKKVAEFFAAQLSMDLFKNDPVAAAIYTQAMDRAITVLEKGEYKV